MPTLVLQLRAEEILRREESIAEVDVAVAKGVGMVVLDCGDESGGSLYEAACRLKSVIGDRAYFLIAERVDIASAVGASGVVLSDKGWCQNVIFLSSTFKIHLFFCSLSSTFDICMFFCGSDSPYFAVFFLGCNTENYDTLHARLNLFVLCCII